MNRKRFGFTIVELLTVLAIIAMLVALLIPSLRMVRNIAKETKQKAQLTTIEMAISAFKGDYGDYPPSVVNMSPGVRDYDGAQKLCEALLGWDLMGFDPNSAFKSDGRDNTYQVYPSPFDPTDPAHIRNLKHRRGPYLELATTNVFRLGNDIATGKQGLFNVTDSLARDTYVLCDVFGVRKITTTSAGGGKTVTAKAGTPILYYRANVSSKDHMTSPPNGQFGYVNRIYNVYDNRDIVDLKPLTADGAPSSVAHDLSLPGKDYEKFYNFIADPRVGPGSVKPIWPYRADSYILISAGADGRYGTSDDICNF